MKTLLLTFAVLITLLVGLSKVQTSANSYTSGVSAICKDMCK